MRPIAVVLVGLFACTPSGPGPADGKAPVSPTQPEGTPKPEPTPEPTAEPTPDPVDDPEPVARKIEVHMTAATLADDCGGGPNRRPSAESLAKPKSAKGRAPKSALAKGKRACEQSSIQLAIAAPADAVATKLTVKSVEVLRESGELVGTLQVRAPSVWSEADGYTPWNENVEPAQELSVTYAMTQPDWSGVADRWNQTFTVKAVISIAGTDTTVEHAVEVDAPTSLPPGVKT